MFVHNAVITPAEFFMMFKKLFFTMFFACQFFQICYADKSDVNNVFVSILPQKYFAERIAGEHVKVSVMVGNGQNPATYEPTPKQMALLDKSQLYFQIGVPFENIWINAISELNSELKMIECCSELSTRSMEGVSHDHHVGENTTDPHVWTSPVNAKYIALMIKNEFINSYPAHKKKFETNYF